MSLSKSYQLIHGDIATYAGDAIVIGCWRTLHTGNAISQQVNFRLRHLNVDPEKFWPQPILDEDARVPQYSAHFFPDQKMHLKGIILGACYVDRADKDDSLAYKVKTTTANALQIAGTHGIQSIAFPTLLAGNDGKHIDVLLPAMVQEFNAHAKRGDLPKDISLYVHDPVVYDLAVRVLSK